VWRTCLPTSLYTRRPHAGEQLSFFYADQNYTIDGIDNAICDMHRRHHIGFAIVDYLQLIEPGGALKKGEGD
jgi:hypothetical protein